MGVCLSRCGETHHEEAGGGPAVVSSHRNYSFDNNTESLKKFLHLHAAVDERKKSALSSRRMSLEESDLVIPHSSELFSLPTSEPHRSSFAISPSPSQASRASVTSRVANSSPKSRTSCSAWGGRSSGAGCRKRIRPAPRSTRGERDLAAHQRLVEAIARLERLNDGKQSVLRGSSCSDPHKYTTQAPQLPTSRTRHVRHYQLPLPTYTCEESDSDEMFTFFEATSSEDFQVRKKPSIVTTSLHQLVQSARIEDPFPVAEKALDIPVAGNPISKPNSLRQSTEQSTTEVTNIESADAGIAQSMGVEKGDAKAARGALTDTDMNGVATLKKWSRVKRSPSRMRALKGYRRRLSRSLDSRESAVVHGDFDYSLRNAALAPSRRTNVVMESNTTTTAQATFIDAMATEELLGLLPGTSISSCPDIKLEQFALCDKDEEYCTAEFLDTSTVELATSEQCQSSPVMPVEDESAITSADSCHRERDKNPSPAEVAVTSELPSLVEVLLDEDQSLSTLASAASSFREPDDLDNALEDPETSARCQETLSPESCNECTDSPSPSLRSSCPTETGVEVPDFHPIPDTTTLWDVGDSQKFLSKVLSSFLKLLLITDTVHTVPNCRAPLDQDEKMASLQEATPTLQ